MGEDETEPLIATEAETSRVESRPKRWILLAEFCALAFLQSSIFLSWNPIANSALFAFAPDWTPSTFAWQINLATITSPFIQFPVWKSLKRFNLGKTIRWLAVFPLVLASFLNMCPLIFADGMISNCLYKWLTYGSFLFTGLTGVVFFSCITRFSSAWFPPGERNTSTALSCMMANLGGLLPSLIGPQMVTDPLNDANVPKESIAHQIYLNMLVYFLLALITFAVFFWHFPDPPEDDHEAEDEQIHDVKSECLQVVQSKTCLSILLVASLGSIPHIWGSTLLTVTLSSLKITQKFVGWVTTCNLIFSTLFTVAVSRLADLHFKRNLKMLIMTLMPVHALSMIGLSIVIAVGNSNYKYCIGFFYVIGIAVLNSVSPLILELGSEATHPISEDIMAGIINQANNLVGVIFYLLFSYFSTDSIGWLLYLMMTVPVITLIMFSMTKEIYNR